MGIALARFVCGLEEIEKDASLYLEQNVASFKFKYYRNRCLHEDGSIFFGSQFEMVFDNAQIKFQIRADSAGFGFYFLIV